MLKIQNKAFYNWLSLLSFILAMVFGLLTTEGYLSDGRCGDWNLGCLVYGVLLASVICLLGFGAGIVALKRNENLKWLSWLGLIINGLVVLAVFVVYLMITIR